MVASALFTLDAVIASIVPASASAWICPFDQKTV